MDFLTLKPLVDKGYSTWRISEELKTSQTNVRYFLKRHGLKTVPVRKTRATAAELASRTEKKCTSCNMIKPVSEYYVHSRKTGGLHSYCKACLVKRTIDRQRLFKQLCVDYKGGKCERCGYCKSNSALDFHHIDPTIKDFNIANARLTTFNEKVKAELDKCLLVCSNCHREIHDEMYVPKGV